VDWSSVLLWVAFHIQLRNRSPSLEALLHQLLRAECHFQVWHLILLQGVLFGIGGGFFYAPVILWVRNLHLSFLRINVLTFFTVAFRMVRSTSGLRRKCDFWRDRLWRGPISHYYQSPPHTHGGISLDAAHMGSYHGHIRQYCANRHKT
jgi:hypothetical protein